MWTLAAAVYFSRTNGTHEWAISKPKQSKHSSPIPLVSAFPTQSPLSHTSLLAVPIQATKALKSTIPGYALIKCVKDAFFCGPNSSMSVNKKELKRINRSGQYALGDAIPCAWIGDGICDCEDGSDEPSTPCLLENRYETKRKFNCGDGTFISYSFVNDGVIDCGQTGADEAESNEI